MGIEGNCQTHVICTGVFKLSDRQDEYGIMNLPVSVCASEKGSINTSVSMSLAASEANK